MNKQTRIGIYGGTFDPIHNGHLNLAFEMMDHHELDEIWFCPAKTSPHKQEMQATASHHRVKMLELALDAVPSFGILMNEIQRTGISYTIDTLKEILLSENKHPYPAQVFLVLGDDSVARFLEWKDPEEIVKLVPILVGKRSCEIHLDSLKQSSLVHQAFLKGLTTTRVMEISATEIRRRIQEKKYIGHLVPPKVVDYIYENDLYSCF